MLSARDHAYNLLDLTGLVSRRLVYRAELYEYVATPPVSRSPVLQDSVELSGTWWHNLHQALDRLSRVPTSREAVREQYIHRRVPEFTGITPGEIAWTTGHGDLH